MNLLLLRHGHAEDSAANGRDDDRALTEGGKLQLTEMRHFLWKIFPKPSKVLCSPALRTRQTAEIVVKDLICPLQLVEELRSESDPSDFADFLQGVQEETILAVSHQPFLGRAIGWFTTSKDQGVASFPRAAICQIELDLKSGRGRLKSLIRPEQLQSILNR